MDKATYRNNPGAIYNRVAELVENNPVKFNDISVWKQELITDAFAKSVRQHKSRKMAVWAAFGKIKEIVKRLS